MPVVLSEADENWAGERRHRPRRRKAKGRRTRGRERAGLDAGDTEQREGGEKPGGGDGPGGSPELRQEETMQVLFQVVDGRRQKTEERKRRQFHCTVNCLLSFSYCCIYGFI